MNIANKTYARGRAAEIEDDIAVLQSQLKHTKASLRSVVNRDEINVSDARALLADYEEKSDKLSDLFKALYEIKEAWGLK